MEGRSNAKEAFRGEIAQPAFDLADVGVIQAGFGGELLLREAETLPMTSNRCPEQLKRSHQEVA